MVVAAWKVLAFLALTGQSFASSARDCARTEEIPLAEALPFAKRYAPVFWFAPGERYFPTLPFFTAFEAGATVSDTDLIAPTEPSGKVSWAKLDDAYKGHETSLQAETQKLRRSAVFYRVRCLDRGQVAWLWKYVDSDEQANKRLRRDMNPDTLAILRNSSSTEWLVVEYYLYYLNDLGLIGHPHDIEMVYVFVPTDTVLAKGFRITVGDAHTDRIPNNVRVDYGPDASASTSGVGLRPWILVELGDHSNAPDVDPYGRFAPGQDVNWHAYDLWGVRDVQASGAVGAVGAYQLWMTFPREASNSALLFPPEPLESLTAARHIQHEGHFDTVGRLSRYTLLPASGFESLFVALRRHQPEADEVNRLLTGIGKYSFGCDSSPAGTCTTLVGNTLGTGKFSWSFTSFRGLSRDEAQRAVDRMVLWTHPLERKCRQRSSECSNETIASEDNQVWLHPQYRAKPDRIFKRHLFRPVSTGPFWKIPLYGRYRVVLSWYPGEAMLASLAWEVPASSSFPVRLPGYLELRGGVYFRCTYVVTFRYRQPWNHVCNSGAPGVQSGSTATASPALSIVHTSHYSAPFAWYAGGSLIPRRPQVLGDSTRSRWLVSAGLSLVPASIIRRPNTSRSGFFPKLAKYTIGPLLDLVCGFRVRVGLVAGLLPKRGLALGENRWEFQFSTVEATVRPRQIVRLGRCAE